MKVSIRQILASTAGAVIAAVIASIFGVKGTIVGVAIGSAAATMATAFVAQSIERGHQAVKQVVVRAPETSTLLRKLGGTGASGGASPDASSAPTEVVGRSEPAGRGVADTVEMASPAPSTGKTERLEISAAADAPAAEHLRATTLPMQPSPGRPRAPRRFSWGAIAGTAAVVFVLALLFITAIELISGQPLSAIFGGADTGTTLHNLVNPPPASTTTSTPTPTSTSTTSTTPTTSSSTTTTTTSGTSTTSTTAPAAQSTTTSSVPSTTTTLGVGGTTTTTTLP